MPFGIELDNPLDTLGSSLEASLEAGLDIITSPFEAGNEIAFDVAEDAVEIIDNTATGVVEPFEEGAEIALDVAGGTVEAIRQLPGFDIIDSLFGGGFLGNCKTLLGNDHFLCVAVDLFNTTEGLITHSLFSSPLIIYIFSIVFPLYGIIAQSIR